MSDDTAEQFDPRFDPAFQRGFDPTAPVARSIPERVVRPRPPVDQPPGAAFVVPKTFAVINPVAQPPLTATPDAPHVSPVELAEREVADAPSLRRNPYLFALGIIAIVLVIAGIWLFVASGNAFDGREVLAQGDYMSLTASIQVAPFISILGGATAIGVLFMIAARWRGKG